MVAFLIRHGHSEAVGQWLAGRRDGVHLSAAGLREADALCAAFRWLPLTAVYSSPLERAVRTAQPLADDRGLRVRIRERMTDIDFGDWTGKTLDELSGDAEWMRFNRDRCSAAAPGGESLAAVQRRFVEDLRELASDHGSESIAVITHAEPIRCAIAAFTAASLDEVCGIEICTAHVTPVGLNNTCRTVLAINVPADDVWA
jgi:broad specificity phosphatase PhoE